MASKKQVWLLGCLLLLIPGVLILTTVALFLGSGWFGDGMSVVPGGKVGLVYLDGPIYESRSLVDEIEANRSDGSVKSVVLRVNSPGGEVAPSQEIHDALVRLAASKPVVASVGGMAASGAYYAAVATDSILADPGSVVGSIGVIFSYPTAVDLMEKIGVDYHVYKSGRLKDIGSFAREPTEEDEAVFDSIIADVYDQFVVAVMDGRGMDREKVLGLADGRIYSGRQAVEVGLVDRLGDLHAAVAVAARLGGLEPDPRVIRKARPRIPLLDLLDQLAGDQARSSWGPRLEYRLR